MKKNVIILLSVLAVVAFLPGCIKDKCKSIYRYTYYVPTYKTAAEVRANIRSNAPRPVERPGKIYVQGRYIFLNEIDKGIHIIDNANPRSPVNKAFIDIPGNADIAVKGTTLYADLYTDMVSLDIGNPLQVTVTKILDGVFPYRYYGNFTADQKLIITDWEKRDTTVIEECNASGSWPLSATGIFMSYSASAAGGKSGGSVSPYGVGGSMARFAIVGNRLYTVSNSDLNVFNITNATQPAFSQKNNVGAGIETIYPFKNSLFIGSTAGMFVYNIFNPDNPVKMGQFAHVQSCDPVVADDDYAYVTLRSGTTCRGSVSNELDVLKLNTLMNPSLVKSYPLTNPHGLAKDGDLLLICDGKDGLKIYNAGDANNLWLLGTVPGIETYDVIALGGTAIVVAKDGLYQYDYSTPSAPGLLSKITVSN